MRLPPVPVILLALGCAATGASRPSSSIPCTNSTKEPKRIATSAAPSEAPPPALPRRPLRTPTAVLFEPDVTEAGFYPRADAVASGIDGEALDRLIMKAQESASDSLIVLKDGRTVTERYFGKKRGLIETMSVTKSIVAIAVMLLIEDGKIASVDAPLSTWFPDFAGGDKAKVTLRHVLTQSSGIAHDARAEKLNLQRDRTQFARRKPVTVQPGSTFSYNNEATQLLSGVIRAAQGKPADQYLDERLFKPLGINEWQWDKDRAGNVQTFYGLALHARDLARIGLLLLNEGRLGDTQIISRAGVLAMLTPSRVNPYHGLLWWLRYDKNWWVLDRTKLQRLKFLSASKLSSLLDRRLESEAAFWLEAGARLSPDERTALVFLMRDAEASPLESRLGNQVSFYASGWLGQRLAVWPTDRLVVVRQRRSTGPDDEENDSTDFPSLLKLSEALVAREH